MSHLLLDPELERAPTAVLSQSGVTTDRESLERRFRPTFRICTELRRLVTYVPNKKLPVYNWFKYKEGFSRDLVIKLLQHWHIPRTDYILDPFAGSGTTLLAGQELAYHTVGIDVLPIAVYVAKTKLHHWNRLDELSRAIDQLMRMSYKRPHHHFPDVRIIDKAFTPKTQTEIMFYKESIERFKSPVRDFLMLGLLSILERVSFTSKDGQFLRLVERAIPPVKDMLRQQLAMMLMDVRERHRSLFQCDHIDADMFQGDARETILPRKYAGRIGAVITSPPYLNRYDYSRTYALELCALFVNNFEELRSIRHSLVRSHIESQEHHGKEISIHSLDEVLFNLSLKTLNNDRIPIMIKGYFEDMNLCIKQMARYLKPGGLVALVVANARFEGELVPTDLILSELAEQQGFSVEEIWITRFKGNSSQQMAKYGRTPVRETIVFWRKRRDATAS